MKVFNITDASTAALRNRGLENQHIRVGDVVIAPGASTDIRGSAKELSELASLIKAGAIVRDQLPPWYASKRGLKADGTPQVVVAEPPKVEPVIDVEPEPAEEWVEAPESESKSDSEEEEF